MEHHSLLLRNPGALPLLDFSELADIPPELEWFANLDNANTKKAYERDVKKFMAFAVVSTPSQLRQVSRAHVIAWRKQVEGRGHDRFYPPLELEKKRGPRQGPATEGRSSQRQLQDSRIRQRRGHRGRQERS